MNFNTLEIIGLAFLSGLNIAEIAEDVMNEEETEKKNVKENIVKLNKKISKQKLKIKLGK